MRHALSAAASKVGMRCAPCIDRTKPRAAASSIPTLVT